MIVLTLPYPVSCVEFDGAKHEGYGAIRHNGKVVRAHRLSYCQANGVTLASIAGLSIRHKCDNPACINPAHLEVGTHTENMRDMAERGRNRQPKGERNAKAKLTESMVRSLRQRHASGESVAELARQLSMNSAVIWRACNRKTWRHVS